MGKQLKAIWFKRHNDSWTMRFRRCEQIFNLKALKQQAYSTSLYGELFANPLSHSNFFFLKTTCWILIGGKVAKIFNLSSSCLKPHLQTRRNVMRYLLIGEAKPLLVDFFSSVRLSSFVPFFEFNNTLSFFFHSFFL